MSTNIEQKRLANKQNIKSNEKYYDLIHQHVCINECYMSNRVYFERIALYDIDELIIPKRQIKTHFDTKIDLNCTKNLPNKSDLEVYFESLSKISKYKNATSYLFRYANVMYEMKETDIIQKIINFVNKPSTNATSLIIRSYNNKTAMKFQVKTKIEYQHARYLIDLYQHYNYKSLKSLKKDRFNIFFMLIDYTKHLHIGKSIHNTNYVHNIGIHYTDRNIVVDNEHGLTTHFRKAKQNRLLYKYKDSTPSITKLDTDYQYIRCYL